MPKSMLPESFQQQMITDVMTTSFKSINDNTNSYEALYAARDVSGIVVEDEKRRLWAVLTAEMIQALPDLSQPLTAYRNQFLLPAIALPDLPLLHLLYHLFTLDQAERACVVVVPSKILGIALFDNLQQIWRSFTENTSPEEIALLNVPNGCYLCTNEPPHHIGLQEVEEKDTYGNAICPCDGTLMNLLGRCDQGVDKC